MDPKEEVYPGGFASLLKRFEKKQSQFVGVDAFLEEIGTDFDALANRIIPAMDTEKTPETDLLIESKWKRIRALMQGQSELAALHALCIAVLRRRDPSPRAVELFFQIWREQGEEFVQTLDARWMISAATTFGDHGQNDAQRRGGQGMSMLFDLIKLHDSERRLSGRPGHFAFRKLKDRKVHSIAFDLAPYSVTRGDLDVNMLVRLWQYTEADPVFRPLGMRMMELVLTDKRTIFNRLQHYKRQARKKAKERAAQQQDVT